VHGILRARELILGGSGDNRPRPGGMLAQVQSRGWVVLDEVPDREIVVGAATKPWEANVTFRPIPGTEFAAFQEPNYIKIVWALRADAGHLRHLQYERASRSLRSASAFQRPE